MQNIVTSDPTVWLLSHYFIDTRTFSVVPRVSKRISFASLTHLKCATMIHVVVLARSLNLAESKPSPTSRRARGGVCPSLPTFNDANGENWRNAVKNLCLCMIGQITKTVISCFQL